jgi:DNA excision repair protein ERCC-5
VAGIGIVNAMEIVLAWDDGAGRLTAFKQWVDTPDGAELLQKVDDAVHGKKGKGNGKEKKGKGKQRAEEEEVEKEDEAKTEDAVNKTPQEVGDIVAALEEEGALEEFKRKHRGARKNWVLPAQFPSDKVVHAYMHPQVDRAKDKFEWGCPDRQLLHQFCYSKVCVRYGGAWGGGSD